MKGTRVEMNFLLLSSRAKESGLEVACKGEIVRLETPLSAEFQSALAVKISDYRLLPFAAGRMNQNDPFSKPTRAEASDAEKSTAEVCKSDS
jgi:hypothetical protein